MCKPQKSLENRGSNSAAWKNTQSYCSVKRQNWLALKIGLDDTGE